MKKIRKILKAHYPSNTWAGVKCDCGEGFFYDDRTKGEKTWLRHVSEILHDRL